MSKMSEEKPSPQDCVVVLGMHRSGTSALAGVLSLLGCATPASLIPGDENNEKGYFESNAIGRLSDAILEKQGSAWDDWTPLELDKLPQDQYLAFSNRSHQAIRDDYDDAPLFVLKEPRMCRMVPFWMNALRKSGCAVHIVHTHRNPQEVAASLAKRDGFTQAFSLLLWLRHVLDAESATRGQKRAFTSYQRLMQGWRQEIDALEDTLEVSFFSKTGKTTKAVNAFLNDRLQHFSDKTADTLTDATLPQNVRDAFAILECWVETGEESEDYATLDKLRAELSDLSSVFAPLVRPGQMAMSTLAESHAELASAKTQAEDRKAELNTLHTELASAKTQVEDRKAELNTLHAELASAKTQVEDRKAKLNTLHAALESATQSDISARADLAQKEEETLKLYADIRVRDRDLEAQARNMDRIRVNFT
jgi:hypothetical protein